MKHSKITLLVATSTLAIGSIYAIKPKTKRAAPFQIYAGPPFNVILCIGGSYPHFTTIATPKRIYFIIGTGLAFTIRTGSSSTSKTIYFK